MSTESKRFRFINTLNEISQKPGLDDYVRYREMGQKCILSDYFLGQGKYLTYERNNATGEISKFFKDKPKFSDKNNGFVAVNVEVPSSASGRGRRCRRRTSPHPLSLSLAYLSMESVIKIH